MRFGWRGWCVAAAAVVAAAFASASSPAQCDDCVTKCKESEKDSRGCCKRSAPPPQQQQQHDTTPAPPPQLTAAQLADQGQLDTAIAAATPFEAPHVATRLREANRCRDAIQLLAKNGFTVDGKVGVLFRDDVKATFDQCDPLVVDQDLNDALQRKDFAAAQSVLDAYELHHPKVHLLHVRLEVARGSCDAARAEYVTAVANEPDTHGDGAAFDAACPVVVDHSHDHDLLKLDGGGFYAQGGERFSAGLARSSRGVFTEIGGGYASIENSTALFLGGGLVLVGPGASGGDGRLADMYGGEFRLRAGTDPRRWGSVNIDYTFQLANGRWMQGPDLHHGFTGDVGLGPSVALRLGGAVTLAAMFQYRIGFMADETNPTDLSAFSSRWHGISSMDVGLALVGMLGTN